MSRKLVRARGGKPAMGPSGPTGRPHRAARGRLLWPWAAGLRWSRRAIGVVVLIVRLCEEGRAAGAFKGLWAPLWVLPCCVNCFLELLASCTWSSVPGPGR